MARGITFKLEVISPIHMSSRRYQTFNETAEFIPATTFRGMLANVICAKRDKLKCENCDIRTACDFDKIFPEDAGVRFENLYTLHNAHTTETDYILVYVLPATAVSCKRNPGFSSQFKYELSKRIKKPYDTKPHGVFDTLIMQLAHKIVGNYDYNLKCPDPECCSKTEPFNGFYNFAPIGVALMKSEVPKRRMVRTAINRARRTAEEEMLYSLEVIEEGTLFFGAITLKDDSLAAVLENRLKGLKDTRLGGVRSRGFGEINIFAVKNTNFDGKVKERIQTFNHFLGEYIQKHEGEKNGEYFVLDLQSDVIMKNGMGEYSAIIDKEMFLRQLQIFDSNLSIDGLELFKWTTSQGHFSAWSNVWKLNRDIEPTIKSGCVFVFKVDAITDELINALEKLQTWGIGERCEEGFGKVVICDPFHWGFQEKDKDYNPNWRY